MKTSSLPHVPPVVILLLGLALVIMGCGRMDAPTASQPMDENVGSWNPGAGEHVLPGDEIPMYEPGYWESRWGMAINPANLPTAGLRIGPEGGVIHLGVHTLTIPAGALDRVVSFQMAVASMNAVGVDCFPSGLTFNVPVTLSLSYAGTQYQNVDNPNLSVFYARPDGTFERYASIVDGDHRTVSAQLNHFSRYILSGFAQ
jgi:hypothetical protein